MNLNKDIPKHILVLSTPVVFAIVFALLSVTVCGGWNTGSMSGTCVPSFFQPLYTVLGGIVFMSIFTIYFWLPIILVFYIVNLVKIFTALQHSEGDFLRNNWFSLILVIVWIPVFVYAVTLFL